MAGQDEQIDALASYTRLSALSSILSTVGCLVMGAGCIIITGVILLLYL